MVGFSYPVLVADIGGTNCRLSLVEHAGAGHQPLARIATGSQATPEAALEDFKRMGFKMGAHKSFLFGRTLTAFDVAVVAELDPEILRKCHLRAGDPRETVERWVADSPGKPSLAVIPNANTTYFYPG